MKKKDLEQLKSQDIKTLKKKVDDLKKEAANFKIEISLGKVKNVHSISQKKKDIAKIMTILNIKSKIAKIEVKTKVNKEVKVGAR
ncbi:MAG: 50S ribosomal protein L29 [Candidatus Curtissbacteria bacterium]